MYSLFVPDNPKESKIRAKGIKTSYVKKAHHEQFLTVLKTLKPTPSTFRSFQSTNHVLRSVEINKTCLNAFDDKRYILKDGVGTRAYGHFMIPRSGWVGGVVTLYIWTCIKETVYSPHCLVVVRMSCKLHHLFTAVVAGPTSSGKSKWVLRLIDHANEIIEPPPTRIWYCYCEFQPTFNNYPRVHFHEGLLLSHHVEMQLHVSTDR